MPHRRRGDIPMAHPVSSKDSVTSCGPAFGLRGVLVDARPVGNGHIHDTWVATYREGNTTRRYIHQRINRQVFPDPARLMRNIARVTTHVQQKVQADGQPDPERRALTLVPTVDRRTFWIDPDDGYWRVFHYIEGARVFEEPDSLARVRAAARAFAEFQCQLIDLPPPPLDEILPGFHDTPARLVALRKAVAKDPLQRADSARDLIHFIEDRASALGRYVSARAAGELPVRVTHNDTKLNNILFDVASGRGLCVIDLDTVMPGLAAYDFGDLVRTTVSPAPEDETDEARIIVRLDYFQALAEGYLGSAREYLTQAELNGMADAGWLITLETGMRFLTDFLEGDRYFKIHRSAHNLERARSQLALAARLEDKTDALRAIVERIHAGETAVADESAISDEEDDPRGGGLH